MLKNDKLKTEGQERIDSEHVMLSFLNLYKVQRSPSQIGGQQRE